MTRPWWQTATVYQIYPRSFRGRGAVGDLNGVIDGLPYLRDLGVDALWISPFYRSPMRDFGYDVSDYRDVDPMFGTLDDFDRLLHEAHQLELKVMVDWVPNHTSDQHPWFVESRTSRSSPKRDWYVWRDGDPSTPPNNWVAAFTNGPAWTWDVQTEQWYLHLFLPEQPDLNWANPEVVEAMHGVLRFWLDRGVDGFRIDVVHALGKHPDLPDTPPELAGIPHSALNDHPSTHAILRDIRSLIDSYPGDRAMVGEVYLLSTARVARYYGDGDELHMAFNFPPLYAPWDATAWRKRIERVEEEMSGPGSWPTWVLSNHDNPRHRTRYGGSEARARAAAVLLLGLRGTPFLYAGEELGLEDAAVPPERIVDPGGRDGCRGPIPWTSAPDHGWGTSDPWLPFARGDDAATQASDPGSVLHLYRRLLAVRRASPALQHGELQLLDGPEGCLLWRRWTGDDERLVAVNFSDRLSEISAWTQGATVQVSSDGSGEGEPFSGSLPPDSAVVLDPTRG